MFPRSEEPAGTGYSEDLVILGIMAPDEAGGRGAVSAAAYSEERGLVRVYPVPTRTRISRWDVISAPLERSPLDDRAESWKIRGWRSEWSTLYRNIRHVGRLRKDARADLLERLAGGRVEGIGGGGPGLCMVKPEVLGWYLVDGDGDPAPPPGSLSGIYRNYPRRPVIEYRCPGCAAGRGRHRHALREWGALECMRKFPGRPGRLWDYLGIGGRPAFLVGRTRRGDTVVAGVLHGG